MCTDKKSSSLKDLSACSPTNHNSHEREEEPNLDGKEDSVGVTFKKEQRKTNQHQIDWVSTTMHEVEINFYIKQFQLNHFTQLQTG